MFGVWHDPSVSVPILATAAEALAHGCDVFVEYTKPEIAKASILGALAAGAACRRPSQVRRLRLPPVGLPRRRRAPRWLALSPIPWS
jgi:hypothetical protein